MVRLKHRYLLVNILYPEGEHASNVTKSLQASENMPYTVQFRQPSSDSLNIRLLLQIIRNGVSELFGDYGSGMIAGSLQVKYFSPATSTAIIRVSRDHYRLVWAALTFVTRLPKPIEQSCVMQVVRVSGTIKKAEEEAIRRARLSIRRAQKVPSKVPMNVQGQAAANAVAHEADDDGLGFVNGIEDLEEPDDFDEESD